MLVFCRFNDEGCRLLSSACEPFKSWISNELAKTDFPLVFSNKDWLVPIVPKKIVNFTGSWNNFSYETLIRYSKRIGDKNISF